MLDELNGIQLGPIFLSFKILSLAISLLFAYFTFGFLLKKNNPSVVTSKVLNIIQTSGLLFLITFKFLPFLMNPSYIFTPSKLLIYTGGPYAVPIAMFVSLSYFAFYFYKEKWSFNIVDDLAIAAYVYFILDSLLLKKYGVATPFTLGFSNNGTIYHPINIYYMLLYSLFLVTLYIFFKRQRPGVLAIMFFVAYFFIQTLISPFI